MLVNELTYPDKEDFLGVLTAEDILDNEAREEESRPPNVLRLILFI